MPSWHWEEFWLKHFPMRMDQLVKEMGFPKDWRKKIGMLWTKIRYYTILYQKVSMIPSYRVRNITSFVDMVNYILEQSAGIKFDKLMRTMTIEDVERLSRQFGDTLAPEENYNI
jgi:hypothetical protein